MNAYEVYVAIADRPDVDLREMVQELALVVARLEAEVKQLQEQTP